MSASPFAAARDLRIAFYGDDFTGSTDTLATLADSGARAMLFLGVPTQEQLAAAGPLDALGIAGAARSMSPSAMREELEPVARFFRSLRAPVSHYKTCSTFDSSPDTGSIGMAVSILRACTSNPFVPIVGGQPNLDRYCIFGNLFASAGTGGPIYRIDRHPTMRQHPVTPMNEADLGVHLGRQGFDRIVNIDCRRYDLAASEQDAVLDEALMQSPGGLLFDIGHDSHLGAVGRMIWQRAIRSPLLAVGPSGVTQSLLKHWSAAGPPLPSSAPRHSSIKAAERPVFVLAGSLSPVTARQIESARSYTMVPLSAQRLLAGDSAYIGQWLARVGSDLDAGRNVLVRTVGTEAGDSAHPHAAAPGLAGATGSLLSTLLQAVPMSRIGLAGGDTSSLAVKALDIWGLEHVGTLAPGVSLCRARSGSSHLDGIEFMLKGGQMGPIDIFDRLVAGSAA